MPQRQRPDLYRWAPPGAGADFVLAEATEALWRLEWVHRLGDWVWVDWCGQVWAGVDKWTPVAARVGAPFWRLGLHGVGELSSWIMARAQCTLP